MELEDPLTAKTSFCAQSLYVHGYNFQCSVKSGFLSMTFQKMLFWPELKSFAALSQDTCNFKTASTWNLSIGSCL